MLFLLDVRPGLAHAVLETHQAVMLRQRREELPKLVETCKQYMQHERSTMEQIIRARDAVAGAREQGDVGALGRAETGLRAGLGHLSALAENYPELRANESFRYMQQHISGLKSGIADRRELYNESVNLNNVRIEQVPHVLLASVRFSRCATAAVQQGGKG